MKKNWFRKLIAATLCTIMLVQIPIQAGAVTPAATQEEETILPPPAEESDGEDTASIQSGNPSTVRGTGYGL